MIGAVSAVSTAVVSGATLSYSGQRKSTLVALGLWGLVTGRGWVVKAVGAALEREGLTSA